MTLHPVDVSQIDPVEVTVTGVPEVDFINISDLVIDDSYQRSIERRGWTNIRNIALNFDWAKFSPLMVSRRQYGKFAIIDGQHRAHAAKLCGIVVVPALVSNLTMPQEASAFSWINGAVTALTPNQIFRAALAACESWAVQCDAVVKRGGGAAHAL